MESPWYIARHNQKYGPYSAEELQQLADSGKLAGEDLIWREGLGAWQPARVVLGHFARTPAAPPPLPSSAPQRVSQRHQEEEEDYPSIRLAERPRGQFPGRLISPGFFLFSLLLFLLPWVDVHCDHVFVVASQSGLQACIGDYSESTLAINERLQRGNEVHFNPQEERLKPAVLLILYGFLLLAGLIAGLAIPVGKIRLAVVASCTGVAFALLVAQVAVGFPIKEPVARANARQQLNPMPPGFPVPPAGPFGPAPVAGNRLSVHFTAVFWLAFLFTLGPVGGLLIEHLAVFAGKRKRKRYAYS